ncbi:MAG: AMMECR1 domain-containing protein [Candidatus Obscuribacter sp.]|nr:AMMECR1 domain-containing protein [Candidatus Obscuribacter sp.]
MPVSKRGSTTRPPLSAIKRHSRPLISLLSLALLSIILPVSAASGQSSPAKPLSDQHKISKKLTKTPLNLIAQATMQNHFAEHPKSLKEMVKTFDLTPEYRQSRGLFVTFYKDGKTRACWGNITPNHADLVTNTVFTTIDCLTKEYRFSTVQKKEIADLKAQVTIIEAVEPVMRGTTLHPLTDGLMVRGNGKGAVLLPGEASDPHYQVMQCKLKAGINPNEPCQIYRIKAHVIR